MKIKDILKSKRTISCEFFPPRDSDGIPGVLRTAGRIRGYNPDFVSVTYGAGGSTRAFTEENEVFNLSQKLHYLQVYESSQVPQNSPVKI